MYVVLAPLLSSSFCGHQLHFTTYTADLCLSITNKFCIFCNQRDMDSVVKGVVYKLFIGILYFTFCLHFIIKVRFCLILFSFIGVRVNNFINGQ